MVSTSPTGPSGPAEPSLNAERLTVAWVLALGAITLLAITRTILMETALDLQRASSEIVGLAGSQRALGTEVLDAIRPDPTEREPAGRDQQEIDGLLDDLTSTHAALRARIRTLEDPELANAGSAILDSIGPVNERLVDLARRFDPGPADTATGAIPGGMSDRALASLVSAEASHRSLLEGLVISFDNEAARRLEEAESLNRSMLLATLALVFVEAFLVFRPATRRIHQMLELRRRQAEAERERTKQQLERLARYDHLTGLANRVLLRDRIDHAVAHARRSGSRVALLYLDLDKFKDVNDQFGHDVGDELLVEVASRLRKVARETDTVARLGGDEFTLVLEQLDDLEGAATVARKVIDAIEEPFELGGRQVHVTASIGIAVFPDDAHTVEDLTRHADSAMYEAKSVSRGAFQFSTPELREANLARLQMIHDLRSAVSKDRLRLVYQPQIALSTGHVAGVEALVRWVRPDGTEVPASEFIDAAEDTDLMGPLNEWVMREATAQALRWQEQGLPAMRIAINVSGRQFRQPVLATVIASALNDTGLDPSLIELEITEAALVEDVEASHATLRLLKGMGVRLAIDDFGTGYSSLSYLKRFPIDSLKIDGSFLAEAVTAPADSVVPAAITSLAHHLGLETTAEGVEHEEQLAMLRSIGCDRAQGFLISPPIEAAELDHVVRRQQMSGLGGGGIAGMPATPDREDATHSP